MIVELFASPILTLFRFLLNLFPLMAFPVHVTEGLFELLNIWQTVDKYVPANFCLILIGAYWTLVNGKLLVAILTWIYEKIPFI